MYTTSKAAEILGISERRVRALARSGTLVAEKSGRDWLIDDKSVEERKSHPVPAGRPALTEREDTASYTLMNCQHEICDIVIEQHSGSVLKAEPHEERFAPPGACPQPGKINRHYLTGWLRDRAPFTARPDLKELLAGKGYNSADAYLFDNLALSLSDCYWLRPQGSRLTWSEVSLFSNAYTDQANPRAHDTNGYSPSTGGAQAKWWEQNADSSSSLVKLGLRDSLAERAATLMYQRLLDEEDYVSYELTQRNGLLCSICADFIVEGQELVSMAHALQCYAKSTTPDYSAYAELCEKLGLNDIRTKLAQMLACDYIMANRDRHTSNLGLIRDSETLEFTGVAPIFDNGQGFFRSAQEAADFEGNYYYIANPFLEMPERQLGLVEDWEWFDSSALNGFAHEAAELFVQHGALNDEAANAMEALLERRIARVEEYALQAAMVRNRRI